MIFADRTRETGVLFAFFVAGSLQHIAQSCREGNIQDCRCFKTVQQYQDEEDNIIFEECGEDMTWAAGYLDNFIREAYSDLGIQDDSPGAIVDFHNVQVGQNVSK